MKTHHNNLVNEIAGQLNHSIPVTHTSAQVGHFSSIFLPHMQHLWAEDGASLLARNMMITSTMVSTAMQSHLTEPPHGRTDGMELQSNTWSDSSQHIKPVFH
ncbi:cysteine desulfurase [Anopheles sinensis]|uniref:Cysteine desulfurase n=1 Tax=Anopheles sinensis TaxID=74873 RepID=A0A084VH31_ANOSI|nr:cysteine desulfurase [Anopheles sinensis]